MILGLTFFILGIATGLPVLICSLYFMGIIVANIPEGFLP
jgi:hypothetical protein